MNSRLLDFLERNQDRLPSQHYRVRLACSEVEWEVRSKRQRGRGLYCDPRDELTTGRSIQRGRYSDPVSISCVRPGVAATEHVGAGDAAVAYEQGANAPAHRPVRCT